MGKEWTVYAAVVACRRHRPLDDDEKVDKIVENDSHRVSNQEDSEEIWVVSCATGSKCTSVRSTVASFPTQNKLDDDPPRRSHANSNRTRADTQTNEAFDDDSICSCYNGIVLKDSHAEALARRGLVACLWDEIEHVLQFMLSNNPRNPEVMSDKDTQNRTRSLLEVRKSSPNQDDYRSALSFRLKHDITLHLYISDSPCGDASIYEIRKRYNQQAEGHEIIEDVSGVDDTELNFTGAKIILCSDEGQHTNIEILSSSSSTVLTAPIDPNNKTITYHIGREDVQTLGALRIKSSRSNIPSDKRTTSMSCSDKILRWGVLGVQGSLLSMFIPERICFSSICVSKDARSVEGGVYGGQLTALERALPGRIGLALKSNHHARDTNQIKPPTVAVVDIVFERSKSAADYRYLKAQSNSRKRTLHTLPMSKKVPKNNDGSAKLQEESLVSDLCPSNDETDVQPHQSATKETACGMSINWHQNFQANSITEAEMKKSTEVTIGATGLKRGKKPRTPGDVLRSASRLCRLNFMQRSLRCNEIHERVFSSSRRAAGKGTEQASKDEPSSKSEAKESYSYQQFKLKCSRYKVAECFNGPMMGYLRSGSADDFVLHQASNKSYQS